ncbi:MAG: nitrogenase-stabilizing/protective protein NifW [Anaeromyxobacteraceae bacterium]
MMLLTERMARAENAEEVFEIFAVPYDPAVLRVYRLRLLRTFGLTVAALDRNAPGREEAERRRVYAEALVEAHDIFARRLAQPACEREPTAAHGCAGCGAR